MSHMFKVLLNEERRVKRGWQGVKEAVCRRMRPATEGCSIVAFRRVEAQKEGRLPRCSRGARGELVGEEVLVGSGLLPGPFEAGQISNTALATSLA